MNTHRIYLNCRLSQGAFSGEMVFEVETSGENYTGVAPKRDCFKRDGSSFTAGELPDRDFVDGMLVSRLIGNGGELAKVSLPDGEAIKVPVSLITERESEFSHVSF